MNYFKKWGHEFSGEWQKMLIASIIATGVIAPIITIGTKYAVKKILKRG